MITDYEKILKLSEDNKVELADSFKDLLHTHIVLGQTRWVCRYGTLSDGHEKVTEAQRYYAAHREMFKLRSSIMTTKANAMEIQADLLDAQAELEIASTQAQKLRANAKILKAKELLASALITIEDQLRMLDEYNKVRLELKDFVESKYPLGIEQAEKDNWNAVYEYRMIKQLQGIPQQTDNIPLPPEMKAELGSKYMRIDSIAPLMIKNNKSLTLKQLEQMENMENLLDYSKNKKEIKNGI